MTTQVTQNAEELGTTKLRKDALAILEAGYKAIQTEKVIREQVVRKDNVLRVQNTDINLEDYRHIFLVGIGKCALDACTVLETLLEDHLSGGMVLDVRGGVLKKLESHVGTHPLPTEHNVAAAQSIADLADSLTKDDLVITVISGGGSALLCLPARASLPERVHSQTGTRAGGPNDLECADLADLTKTLMDKGATISELNTVRKHTSKIQGGQLVARAYPARVVSLIFSDVPSNDISTIASGPTVKDETTVCDAEEVLEKYGIDSSTYSLVETPKDDEYFKNVENVLVLSNQTALDAMKNEAERLGYNGEIRTCCLEGEARDVAKQLVANADTPKTCKLYGGEVTVTLTNKNGKGGRNQELALAALQDIPEDIVLIAVASDGWDNSDVAGALVDAELRRKAEQSGVSLTRHLDAHTSYLFFERAGGHIVTGMTGSNVADFYFTLHG